MDNNQIVKRINQVSNRTALANKDYDFLATHMPFKKLSYSNVSNIEKAKENLTETDFLEKHIYPSRDDHKMIFIKGNSGSGKSHLIRWFYDSYKNRVDEKEELIILISRDSNSLKGTLNQIVGSDLFKGFSEELEFKKIIEAGKSLEEKKLKEDIPALLASGVRTTSLRDLRKRDRDKIANFLSADIIREKILFRDKGPISRIISGLIGNKEERKSEKSFLKEDFDIVDTNILTKMRDTQGDLGASARAIAYAEDIERDDAKKQELVDLLNDIIDEVIKKIIGLGRTDLQEVFKKIRSKLKEENMKLAIFFEDITTTTGIHKELLESLIVDHREVKEELCRIISFVGITESYYSSQIQDNIKGRITHSLDIAEYSLIEDKEDLSKFIGLYMNAINQTEDKIQEWYKSNLNNRDVPISTLNKEKKWSLVNLSNEKEVSIYPFTKDALWNIYVARDKEGREPRGFLRLIVNNLYSNYITNGKEYILDLDVYDNTKIPELKNPLDEEKISDFSQGDENIKNMTESLIRIWGDGSLENRIDNDDKTIGNIDIDIFKHFGLPIISGEIIKKPVDKEVIEGEEITVKPPKKNKKTIQYENELAELVEWRKGGKLVNHKKYRDQILDLYKNFINWEEEDISRYLIDNLLTSALLNIEGQIVDSSRGILFKRNDDLYYLLIGLLQWEYLGDRSWDFIDSHKYVLRITQYLNKYKELIMNLIEKPKDDNWEFEDMLLINSYYFNMLNRNLIENLSLEDLYFILLNNSQSIISDSYNDLDERWRTLTDIYNRSNALAFSQELLIKYFNLPQGFASLKTSGNIEIYTYRILERIKKLKDSNWEIEEYKVSIDRTISIYRPLEFFKKEIQDKIPKLLDESSNNINGLINNLELKFKGKLDENKIKLMSNNINIYLDIIAETGFINTKAIYDEIIYKTNEKEIYDIYNEFKSYNDLSDIDKLLYVSINKIEKLYNYNFSLSKLEANIQAYNKNCEANLKENSDENIDYNKIMKEINENESQVIVQIEKYLR